MARTRRPEREPEPAAVDQLVHNPGDLARDVNWVTTSSRLGTGGCRSRG
ncbi:hypothetical protein [Streptomyces atratus]